MKIIQAMQVIEKQVVGMGDGVLLAFASMLSNTPCLFIGNPGTGKSHAFKLIASQQGNRDIDWFYQSITAKTSPEKLFGGIVADEMLKGIESYNLEVGAAVKKGNIFDEIFKSQHPAMMNALLGYLDEEPTIFTGGKNIKPEYQWIFATTNFEDIQHDLRFCPLWDRFGAKFMVNSLSKEESMNALMDALKNKGNQTKFNLSDKDLKDARDAASKIKLEDSCIKKFYEIIKQTIEKYCYLSQRKIHQIFVGKNGFPSILQSLALLLRNKSITSKLLKYLPYFCWQDTAIFVNLKKEIEALCISKTEMAYLQIKKDYEGFIEKIDNNAFASYAIAQEQLDVLNDSIVRQLKSINPNEKSEVDEDLRNELAALKKSCADKVKTMQIKQSPDANGDMPF